MTALEIRQRMADNAEVISALCSGVSRKQACWKPRKDQWSLLEVICHLSDEEREDFGTRLKLTLNRPEADWPPIDPAAWVLERAYNSRKLSAALEDFLSERQRSVLWLENLESPDWNSKHSHPLFGDMLAKDLLSAWLAHDLLHIRQLTRLHYQYLQTSGDASSSYAGSW